MLGKRGLKLGSALAAMCAAGLYAGSASATLALNQASALSVVPIRTLIVSQTPSVLWSYAVVTNTSSQNVQLHLEFLNGDNWNGQNFSCAVTGEETVLFVFRPTGANSMEVDFKCSFAVITANGIQVVSTPQTILLPFRNGLMTASVESAAGVTLSSNILFADWLVVDFTYADAYGAEAITFQGLAALAQDGNRNYSFNGTEYSTFPAQLASNFIAPYGVGNPAGTLGPNWPFSSAEITAELILFTLDGTVNGQPVAPGGQVDPVALRGNVYNDRENSQSFNFDFDCFTIVDLATITPAFVNTGAGGFMSTAGHFDLTPVATGAGDPAHEFNFGTGNNSRKRPALGWIVQHLIVGAQIPRFTPVGSQQQVSPPFPNLGGGNFAGSFARTIGTSVTSFTPLAGDTPTYSTN